jgi:hypothetical protein
MSHECKRFKTVRKWHGVKLTVRCRECGELRVTEAARLAEALVESAKLEAYSEDMAALTQGNVA